MIDIDPDNPPDWMGIDLIRSPKKSPEDNSTSINEDTGNIDVICSVDGCDNVLKFQVKGRSTKRICLSCYRRSISRKEVICRADGCTRILRNNIGATGFCKKHWRQSIGC